MTKSRLDTIKLRRYRYIVTCKLHHNVGVNLFGYLSYTMKKLLSTLFLLFSFAIFAQVGGVSSFDFLLLPSDARVAAIGGENVSTAGHDVNMILYNPASLADTMINRIAFNYRPFYTDVNKSAITGVFNTAVGPFGVMFQNMGYGDFVETDPLGNPIGSFSVNETAIGVTKSNHFGPFSVGGSLKFVYSSIQRYNASALMLDFGTMYHHPKHDLQIGLVAKNIGFSLSKYTEASDQDLPFDLQAGVSYKLEHMPLRLSITTHHLHQYDIQYLDPTRGVTLGEDGEEVVPTKSTSEKIARHFVFGGEFIFSKNFHARVGYNHLRRKELQSEIRKGGSGFSFGFMVRVNAFEFNFTRAFYHAIGGTTALTLATDLNRFIPQRKHKSKSNTSIDSNDRVRQ